MRGCLHMVDEAPSLVNLLSRFRKIVRARLPPARPARIQRGLGANASRNAAKGVISGMSPL